MSPVSRRLTCTTLCVFRLREPGFPLQDLMSLVAPAVPLREFQSLVAARRPRFRRNAVAGAARARPGPDTRLLRLMPVPNQNTFDRVRFQLASEEVTLSHNETMRDCASVAPFRLPSRPPRHRFDGPPESSTPHPCFGTEMPPHELGEDTSIRSLQPTCCQWHPAGRSNLEFEAFTLLPLSILEASP